VCQRIKYICLVLAARHKERKKNTTQKNGMEGIRSMIEEHEGRGEESFDSQYEEMVNKVSVMEQELKDRTEQNELLLTVLDKEKNVSRRYRSQLDSNNNNPNNRMVNRNEELIEDKPESKSWEQTLYNVVGGGGGSSSSGPSDIVEELNQMLRSKSREVENLKSELLILKKKLGRGNNNRKLDYFENVVTQLKDEQKKMKRKWEKTSDKYERNIEDLVKEKDRLESKLRKLRNRNEGNIIRRKDKGKKRKSLKDKERVRLEILWQEQLELVKNSYELKLKEKEELVRKAGLVNAPGGWGKEARGFLFGNSLVLMVILFFYMVFLSVKTSPNR